ncbi:hypothetical protein [Streptomyces abyssomicinicus]|uniref:hypothetical protein n=1 Tax=Streptomyces abyssomicinicus TaxID=574929 RepID=UPI001250636E|nr:hypothetical protein [Streptomyces abyssomicinicus]
MPTPSSAGPRGTTIRRWVAVATPPVAAAAVHGWAYWFFRASGLPLAVGVGGGCVLMFGAWILYRSLVDGTGRFFGSVLTMIALLATAAAAQHSTPRAETATCRVLTVAADAQPSWGDGPAAPSRHSLTLECPGGYPGKVVTGRGGEDIGTGDTVRVSYDVHRRVSPQLEGEPAPWITLSLALLLLGLASLLARHGVRAPSQETG